jgi:hypothetical protein
MENTVKFENTITRLLAESAESAAARPQFYRELLHSLILICPQGGIEENSDPGKQTATLRLAALPHEGIPYIPFYLTESFLPANVRYVSLLAKQFFEITKGSYLVLNPGSKVVKTFTPDEIERLLSGKLLEAEKEFKVQKNARIIIGKPKEIPGQLLEQLSKFFDSESTVQRAWLGWYHNPALEKMPGYMLAIDATRSVDFRALAGRVTLVLKEVGTGGHYCDIAQYTGDGITDYFRSDPPFYSKPLWSRLKGGLLG